jgi:hypothetical protein
MKITFKDETKRIPDVKKIGKLNQTVSEAFGFNELMQFGENYKFYYVDEDGDTITVTTQGDLEEATKSMEGKVRLYVAKDIHEAQEANSALYLNRSMSLASMKNVPMTGRQSLPMPDFEIESDFLEKKKVDQNKNITFKVEVD